jgi:hypothetical protein
MPAIAAPTVPKPPPLKPPSKMTLANIVKGKVKEPFTVTMHGVEAVGKSTFASNAPKPIFIDGEDGTKRLEVERFPRPDTWEDVKEALRVLELDEHAYQTLVVDTLDWLEPLLWEHICRRDSKSDIEAYGYGKGYVAALDEWRVFLAAIERLRRVRRMNVILLAHSWIKPFKNPLGEDFDRYEMKLHPKAAGLMKEWPDTVLFANFETLAVKDEKTKRVRGAATGVHLLYTERTAAWDAKNRSGLPAEMPLDWATFISALEGGPDPATIRAEIERKAKELGEPFGPKAIEGLTRADSVEKLLQLNNWCSAKLAEKGA